MTCRDFIANGTSVFVAPAIHLVVGARSFCAKLTKSRWFADNSSFTFPYSDRR
jgi:hypothetical protein